MKKFLSLLITTTLLAQLFAYAAYAEDTEPDDNGLDEEAIVDELEVELVDTDDDSADELVEDSADALLLELSPETDDEVLVSIENIDAKIDAEIAALENELNQLGATENDLLKKAVILRKIEHLKDLKIKFREKLFNKRAKLIKKMKKIVHKRGASQLRWGNLESKRPDCATDDTDELSNLLDAGSLSVIPGCEQEQVEYSGSISVDKGTLEIVKKVLFEKNDLVTAAKGGTVSFDSVIAGHWDGIILKYTPDTATTANNQEVNVTVRIGSLNLTVPASNLLGRFDIGNGHQIEFHRGLKIISGVADSIQNDLIRGKIDLEEKLSNVQDKVHRIRLLKPKLPGIFSGILDTQLDAIDELEGLVDDAGEFTYDDEGNVLLEDEINKLLVNLDENLPNKDLLEKIKRLKAKILEIKKAAHQRKYEKNIIPFLDTEDDQWYTEHVAVMKNKNIISGYRNSAGLPLGEFRPANNITVAEILKIALETAEKGQTDGTPNLRSALNHWAKNYVLTAEGLGLSIVQDASLDLNRPATRAEVVQILLEALGISPEEVSSISFPDVPVNHKQAKFIQYAKDLGIVSGDGGTGMFRPDAPVNRAEVAKIINVILQLFFQI